MNDAGHGGSEGRDRSRAAQLAATVGGGVALVLLYFLSRSNYLLFHSLVELFAIVIGVSIFIVAWNTRKWQSNAYLLFLGIAYLAISCVDLLHMLAYRGMGVFPSFTADEPTQLWLLARYLEAFSLLVAPSFLSRRLRTLPVATAYALAVILGIAAIAWWDVFPAAFVKGQGLTLFKIASEYAVSAVLALSLYVLWRRRAALPQGIFRLVAAAIVVTIVEEMAFTLYTDVYGVSNMLGHLLKVVSFFLIYRAVVAAQLRNPYGLVFRQLAESEARFRQLFESAPDAFYINDMEGRFLDANKAAEEMVGVPREALLGRSFMEAGILSHSEASKARDLLGENARGLSTGPDELTLVRAGGREIVAEIRTLPIQSEGRMVVLGIARDVTQRKRREEELKVYAAALATSMVGMTMADMNGRITYVNQACLSMWRYEHESDVIGRSVFDFWSSPESARRALSQLDTEGRFRGEMEGVRADGTVFDVEVSVNVVTDASDQPIMTLGSFMDVTERNRTRKVLQESEAKYRRLFEQSIDAIYIGTVEGRPIDVNQAWLDLFGYSREDMKRFDVIDTYVSLEDRRDTLLELQRHGRVTDVVSYRKKDGTVFECQRSITAGRDSEGRVVTIQGINRDVTAQHRAERALRESEEKFRALFEQSIEPIYFVSPDGSSVEVNRAWMDLFGYTEEQLAGFNAVDVYVDPSDRDVFLQRMHEYGEVSDEVRFKRRDGSVIECQRTVVAQTDESGVVTGFQGIVRDVTDRRRAERAVQASEQEYRNLFEQSRDAIYVIDEDGTIRNVNSAGVNLFGYSRERLIGNNVASLYADPSQRALVIDEARRRGGLTDYELQMRRSDGSTIDCEVTTTILADENGGFAGFQTLMRDVTRQKRDREALERSERELRALTAHLQVVREEERAAVAWELHDEVGQALAAAKMDLAACARRVPPDAFTPIRPTYERVNALLDDTIDRLRRLYSELRPGMLDDLGLAATVRWQLDEFSRQSGLRCEVLRADEVNTISSDCALIAYRVLRGTLENVSRHARATSVAVELVREEGDMVLRVIDDGRGIALEDLQSPDSLGIVEMRESVSRCGGSLDIRPAEAGGTVVEMRLPAGADGEQGSETQMTAT